MRVRAFISILVILDVFQFPLAYFNSLVMGEVEAMEAVEGSGLAEG